MKERLAELNLTKEIDKACVVFNNKVCNLYSTITGQITFQFLVSFCEPTDFISHFGFVIKCYVTFMLFTKCHGCLCPVISFPRAGVVFAKLLLACHWKIKILFLTYLHPAIPQALSPLMENPSSSWQNCSPYLTQSCLQTKKPFLPFLEKNGISENETTA